MAVSQDSYINDMLRAMQIVGLSFVHVDQLNFMSMQLTDLVLIVLSVGQNPF